MITHIYVGGGAAHYVGGTITELTGDDISTATIEMALSDTQLEAPTVWESPSVVEAGASVSERVAKLLVDDSTTPGTYYCWVRVTDLPEVEPIMIQGPIKVV